MLLHIILFSVVLQSITCDFPPWIIRCPLPDPNANNCILNSARSALWNAIHGNYWQSIESIMQMVSNAPKTGDPALGLPNYNTVYLNGDALILEYNFESNNSEIQLFGQMQPLTITTDVYEARINFNWPSWHIVIGGALITSDFDFVLNIYDESDIIQAKGQVNIIQDNWSLNYNGDYVNQQIDNELFMQISWAYAFMNDDTFDVTYSGLSTLDDQPITGTKLVRVKKALRNFENSFHNKQSEFGEKIFTNVFNTILKLVPENEVFLPPQNQCPQN